MLILSACEKDTESSNFAPVVTTGNADNIYRKGATLSGSIQLTETNTAQEYGILFSALESMAEYTEYPTNNASTNYSILVEGLEPGKTYYYCAYASSGYSIARGEIKSFTTTESNAPIFDELTLWSKDTNSCKVSVELIDDGGSNVSMSGFVWKESGFGEPTIYDNLLNVSMRGNSLSATITGLEPNKTYVVRAYAQNAIGVSYSNSVIVPTTEANVPYLSNVTCVDSTTTSITVKSHIIDAGTSAVTKIGFCYSSENSEPTTNHKVIDLTEQIEEQEFTTTIGDLVVETTYYIRAFAENEEGIGYSDVLTYTPKKEEFKAVDLGLSVLWANFNLGATSPEDYGDYYAFGEISPKDTYTKGNWIRPEILYLPAEKDAATQQLGEDWRMPTKAEVNELLTECSWTLITRGGLYAYKVTGKTGESIILPITGEYVSELQNANYEARYRTSEAFLENGDSVYDPSTVVLELQLNFADTEVDSDDGWSGHPIRPVKGERKQEEPGSDVTEKNITLTEAGTLANFITEAEQQSIQKLTISGPINGDDLYLMSKMSRNESLTDLDISKSRIVEGGNYYYCAADNQIPDGIFVDTKLKKILLPNNLTSIGTEAFYDCRNLTNIIIPDGVTRIGERTFSSCVSLTSATIGKNVNEICERAFDECSKLTNIIIPDAVTQIREHAFSRCVSLTNATIGKNVTEIRGYAFEGCSSLSEVTCNSEMPPYVEGYSFADIAYPATLYVPAGSYGMYINSQWAEYFTTITDGVFNPERTVTLTEAGTLSEYITDEDEELITKLKISGPLNGDDIRLIREMANYYFGKQLKYLDLSEARIVSGGGAYYSDDTYSYNTYDNEIGEYMFYQCRYLETILLPKDIEWIGKEAFAACNALKSIDLPNGITSIEKSTFSSCESLTEITLPDGITSIKDHAFMGCSSLTNINIPNGVTSIGNNAFDRCSSLTTIKIPDSVTSMDWEVFYGCSALENITIGSGIESISYRAFYKCRSLKSINIPDAVKELGGESFMGCTSLESATLGKGLMVISDDLFNGCSALKEVTINNDAIYLIDTKAFYNCSSLTSINLPASLVSIGSEAFYQCRLLAEVTCGAGTPPELDGTDVFTRIASSATLIVPAGSATAYSESDWAQYFTTIEEK